MVRRRGVLCAAPWCSLCAALVAMLLSGCGSDTQTSAVATSNARGMLIEDPPIRLASADAVTLAAQLGALSAGALVLQVAGTPTCGVDLYYFEYWTVGAKNEPTTASGALMVPTGSAAQCAGPRPIVLYGHGLTIDKTYNVADITNSANLDGAVAAAVFAAQGYIVVAPNYAGYDISSLSYYPLLIADQNAKDMIDALTAARAALPHSLTPSIADNGQLFLAGYSEGGYEAMATLRELQAEGKSVTATAGLSGVYAPEAQGDATFYGSVFFAATFWAPMVINSFQNAYGNQYTALTDIYEPQYTTGLVTQLPGTLSESAIIEDGGLPESALFSNTPPVTGNPMLDAALAVPANPLFAAGFGASNLITNSYRLSYVLDAVATPDGAVPTPEPGVPLSASAQQPLRAALRLNDMRNGSWAPMSPVLLCGGDQDPEVFFSLNTGVMASFWGSLPAGLVTVLDVNATPVPGSPSAPLQQAFQQGIAGILATGGEQTFIEEYHDFVRPFCAVAARNFFSHF
jgi:hypothetical protein